MRRGRAFVGTSGWSYNHWRHGVFYPERLPSQKWLEFYARHFDTVELNASFYRLPKRETFAAWRETVGSDFVFAVKLWRAITHYNRLVDYGENLERFFDSLRGMSPPIVVLAQLHPGSKREDDSLERFLDDWTRQAPEIPIAVEFRNKTWHLPDVFRELSERKVAAVVHDMPGSKLFEPNDAPLVYIRRHGQEGRYRGDYRMETLEKDAERIREWTSQGKDVFVYFNNDQFGFAPKNAAELKALLT